MQTEVSQGIKSITWEAKIFRADGSVEDLGVIAKTRHQGLVAGALDKIAKIGRLRWRV